MLPTPQSYAVYPSVVPVGVETLLTVAPAERTFLLYDGEEYKVTLRPVDGDDDYYRPYCFTDVIAVPKNGVICVPFTFTMESEYLLYLEKAGKKLATFSLYALEADLYALSPLRGDLHSHSFRSDGSHDPAAVAGQFREQGYDFFALTDHNRRYPGEEIDETYADTDTGLLRISGEEVHAPGSVLHVVHVGGNESVANRYIHAREDYEREVKAYETRVPDHVPEEYRARYARAIWATDAIHAVGGLAIFAHPFWRPGNRSLNLPVPLARLFLSSGMFDAFELIGGGGQLANNRHIALWQEARETGVCIPIVGASDVHGMRDAESFPDYFTLCFAKDATEESVVAAIRKGQTVAVEATGLEYERRYRVYGSLRLVSYAQFLLHNFFPTLTRLAAGEGVAMRAFAMGGTDASHIAASARLAKRYRAAFFGRRAPILPDEEARASVARQRERHLTEGPPTRGSAVDPSPDREVQR